MKKFFYLILCLLIFCNGSYAQNIKFIQATDVHLTKDNSQYLKNFISDVNDKYSDVNFIVFTGDNINNANPEDLETFLSILKQSKIKTYVVMGNHDLYKSKGMSKDYYMHTVKKNLGHYHSSDPNYVFKKGNIVFVAMNGVKEVIPGSCGYYREAELTWLDKMLSKYKNKKVVILQHFPLLLTETKSHNLYKKDEYEKILSKHNNVIGVVSGHYHENRELKDGNIYHIVTKNFSDNKYYKLIEVNDKNDLIYTMLVDNNQNK